MKKLSKKSFVKICWVTLAVAAAFQTVDVKHITVHAAKTGIINEDFTGEGYTIGEEPAPASVTGWYSTFTTGTNVTGDIDNSTVMSSDALPGGRILQNKSGKNITMYKVLNTGINMNIAQNYFLKWHMYIGNDVSTADYNQYLLNFYKEGDNVVGNPSAKVGIIANGGVYRPFIKWGGTGGIFFYNANRSNNFADGYPLAKGKMYTFVMKMRGTPDSDSAFIHLKVYEYGESDVVYSVNTSNFSSRADQVFTAVGFNTFNSLGGTHRLGDIQIDAYTAPDTLDAEAVYQSLLKLTPSFGEVTQTVDVVSEFSRDFGLESGVALSWESNRTEYIDESGSVTRPSAATGDQPVVLTAVLAKGNAVMRKSFPVLVKAVVASPEEAELNAAKAYISNPSAFGLTSFHSVKDNFTLPTSYGQSTTIEWTSDDTDCITTNGVVVRPAGLSGNRTVHLSADIYNSSGSTTETVTFRVLALSGLMAYEDFDYPDETRLSAMTDSVSKGWTGSFKSDLALGAELSGRYAVRADKRAVLVTADANETFAAYRGISGEIDLDMDMDYYMQWEQSMTHDMDREYRFQRVELSGASQPIILGYMNQAVSTNTLHPMMKIASVAFDAGTVISNGKNYRFLVHISARAAGNDTVRMKAYPAGMQEPLGWNVESSVALTGKIKKIQLLGSPNTAQNTITYSGLKIEGYHPEDSGGAAGLEADLQSLLQTPDDHEKLAALQSGIRTLANSIPRESLENRLGLLQPYCEAPVFTIGGARAYYLSGANVHCSIKIVNKTSVPQAYAASIFAAVYSEEEGRLVKLYALENPTDSVGANFFTTVGQQINLPGPKHYIKIFVWDADLQKIVPLTASTEISEAGIQ